MRYEPLALAADYEAFTLQTSPQVGIPYMDAGLFFRARLLPRMTMRLILGPLE